MSGLASEKFVFERGVVELLIVDPLAVMVLLLDAVVVVTGSTPVLQHLFLADHRGVQFVTEPQPQDPRETLWP